MRLLCLALIASACAGARLPAVAARSLDDELLACCVAHQVPAIAALVVEDGTVVARGVAGAEADARWHIGSCAKAMTAVAIARLVDRASLRFDTTMAEVFAELAPTMNPRMRDVTVRQLLDHQSGLPENHRVGSTFTRRIDRRASAMVQRREITAMALVEAPVTEPGNGYEYANTNYLIAGAVIESVTGRPFEHAMRELVFAPLAMSSAGFGQPEQPRGHQRLFGKAVPTRPGNRQQQLPPYYAPSGDVHLSMSDWSRFVRACLGGAFLGEATRREMQAPVPGAEYACGFAVHGDVLAHHGASRWWRCYLHAHRGTGRFVLVACNHGGERGAAACRTVAERLR